MERFEFIKANSAKEAVTLLNGKSMKTKIIAGGLDLVGEMKDHIIEPETVVGIGDIDDLKSIKIGVNSLRVGAAATLSEIAAHPGVRSGWTALADAARSVGSSQIRNVGTLGGNLCQRPRCWYYRNEHYKCLKKGGDQCFAVSGRNKYHAILGGTPCFIAHPSDCAPALIALGATVRLLGPDGPREMPLEEFFSPPAETLERENKLVPGEIVTEIEVPVTKVKSAYNKFREKEGFDWAVSSAAVALQLNGAQCVKADIVLGGVATTPWRATGAEAALNGKSITEALAAQAGEAALNGAEELSDNEYKIALTQTIVRDTILKLIA